MRRLALKGQTGSGKLKSRMELFNGTDEGEKTTIKADERGKFLRERFCGSGGNKRNKAIVEIVARRKRRTCMR